MPTFEGIVDSVIFSNPDNGYQVLSMLDSDKDEFVAVGIIPLACEGDMLRLTGEWIQHRDFGEQLKVESFEFMLPTETTAMEKYLSSKLISGLGPDLAHRLVKHFGHQTFEVLDKTPERIREVDGIGPKKSQQIIESYRERRDSQNIIMYFINMGISITTAQKIFKRYGANSVAVARNDPYRLAEEIPGIGFKIADGLALSEGYSKSDSRRIAAGLKYVLDEAAATEGHTFLPREKLISQSAFLLEVETELVERELMQQLLDGALVNEMISDVTAVFKKSFFEAENDIAVRLMRMIRTAGDQNPDIDEAIRSCSEKDGLTLSPLQKDALRLAASSRVAVITGGPGTGKTTIIKCLIKAFAGRYIALCAPTGRAAKRMSEATDAEALTIHRLLKYSGENMGFQHNEDNPLSANVVIVDEMSMVDIFVMRSLLKALKPTTRLILTGDVDQLPSVGAGNVLKDLISSGALPVVRLTEIFRQSNNSMIALNAHRINSGEMPVINQKQSDFFMEHVPDANSAVRSVCELVTRRLPSFGGFHPLKDIQVMSPMKKGDAGVIALNQKLQALVNPARGKKEITRGQTSFREGDKVIQIRNNYDIEWMRGSEPGLGIFNGDIGFVTKIDMDDRSLTVRFDDGRTAEYKSSILEDLELAYCMSVHKSQGSEFPCVVIPILAGPQLLMTRNLLYTAVTRARKLVVLVGRDECVYAMVKNDRVRDRYTALRYRLERMNMLNERNI